MLVDVIYPGWVPFMSLAIAQSVPGFIDRFADGLGVQLEEFWENR